MTSALCLGYTGGYQEPVTGGYPLGHGYRFYLPALMRFHAPDDASPFGDGGINAYVYCGADPINRTDPSGHFHIGWQGWLGVGIAAFGVGLAVFTDGGSLAAAGAVLGAFSATSGIAAENTQGSARSVLTGISLGTGIAGGVVDAGGVVIGAASALQGAARGARMVDAMSADGQVVTHAGRIEGRPELPGVLSGRHPEVGEPGPASSAQEASAATVPSRPRLNEFLRAADRWVADHPEQVAEHWGEASDYASSAARNLSHVSNDLQLRSLKLHSVAMMLESHQALTGERLLVTDLEGFPHTAGRPNMSEFFEELGYPANHLNVLRRHVVEHGNQQIAYVLEWLFDERYA